MCDLVQLRKEVRERGSEAEKITSCGGSQYFEEKIAVVKGTG